MARRSKVPVYGLWDFRFGHGILDGEAADTTRHQGPVHQRLHRRHHPSEGILNQHLNFLSKPATPAELL